MGATVPKTIPHVFKMPARNGWHAALRALQCRLKTLLQLSALDMDVALAGRDPFGPIPVSAALDRQTDALFAAALRQAEGQVASA